MKTAFRHWRTIRGSGKVTERYYRHVSTWEVGEHGGRTECDILDDDGHVLSSGAADCSVDDSFCYRTGRNISFGRAKKNLPRGIGLDAYAQGYLSFDTFRLM